MADATAAQAYLEAIWIEEQMGGPDPAFDKAGYHVKIPVKVLIDRIIAEVTAVNTYEEAVVGIRLAASNLTDLSNDDYLTGLYLEYTPEFIRGTPQPGAGILYMLDGGAYVSSLSTPY